MDTLRNLLSNVSQVVNTDKKIRKEKFQRGENFNVFNILGIQTNETRTHSAFIAELLNPNGSHGCDSRFLNIFLLHFVEMFIHSESELDNADVRIELELFIGNKNEEESEGGRIDIAIFIGKYLIIIENKIYAKDQKNQLLRYDNYAKQLKSRRTIDEYKLFYLTLDGHEASIDSTTGNLHAGKDYITLSYSRDIISWLNECKAIAVEKPLVRETIIQYINLLKEITNQDMDTKQQEKMFAVMAEFPEAAASIFHSGFTAFRNYVFHNYCSPIFAIEAKKRRLVYNESNAISGEKHAGFQFKKEGRGEFAIVVETETYDKDFYIGIVYRGQSDDIQQLKLDCFDRNPNNMFVCGLSYLSKYKDWYSDIIIAMKNSDYCNYIMKKVDEIICEIERKNCL